MGFLITGFAKMKRKKATILLGYANMREEDIKEAVAILNQCWRK